MTEVKNGPLTLNEEAVRSLAGEVRGQVLGPQDAEYETARRVWNGMIDKHPALIVRCTGTADVVAAVTFARKHNLLTAVRGGGHNVAGNAVCDGGLVIDLAPMKGVRVDLAGRTVRAEPGVVWGEFDHETQAFDLATTGGLVSTTGIAGFTLGGGIGWLARQYGLACDNLCSVDIVTAEGRVLTASPIEHADLFWGVRGGGGNFGIVTSFEFQLHRVGPVVLGGAVFHPLDRGGEVLRFYREYIAESPDELTTLAAIMTAPPLPFIPPDLHGKPALAIAACYAGPIEQGEEVVGPLRRFGPPAAEHLGPVPYTALQSMFDASAPAGMNNYWKSHYLAALDDDAIDTILTHAAMLPAPFSQIHLHQLGGAMSRVSEDATAFSHRNAAYALNIIGTWVEPRETDRNIQWVRDFWAAMERFSTGVYVNFLGDEGEALVQAAYEPQTYQRLVALKRKYDPTNFFRLNQNIKP
jgi:FAD/FMN-containing dehydrogenase